jgi:hypothetical protein
MSQQLQITGGAKVRSLEGVITGSTGVLGSLPINASNGIPQLDVNGKILVSQLPNSVMEYKGTWNAATNTPTLADGTGNQGDVYLCNVAGTVNFGSGPISFVVGDQVIYSGTIWQKASGATGTVTSVAVTESGDALSITGSPITTSGTINIGFAGTSAQYVAGDGSLINFPTVVTQAQNLVTEVYNNSGATMTKGTVVYINGGQGNLPTIAKAIATGDSTSAQTYGVVRTDITNMNNGYVTVIGNLDNLDTQAYAAGTQLYLSSTTAGAWTSTKQYAPAHLVYVGIVIRSHPTQGVVEIRIQNGFELDELHNVSAQTPSNNQGIFYNSSTSLWENKSIATALGYTPISLTSLSATSPLSYNNTTGVFSISQASGSTSGYLSSTDWTTFNNKQNALTNPITGTGASGQIAYFNGTTTQTGSSFLTWDNADAILSTNSIYNYNNTTNAYMLSSDGENIGSIFNVSITKWALGYGTSTTALGTPVLTWDNTGNVGIGTTSPTSKLHIVGATYSTLGYFVPNTSQISFTTSNGSNGMNVNGSTNKVVFVSGGNETMTLDSSANVGIGTTSPSYKLDVSGTGRFSDVLTVNSSSTSSNLNILSLLQPSFASTYGAYLSIGNANSTNNSGALQFNYVSSGSNSNTINLSLYGKSGLTINGLGNVGIGTSSPVTVGIYQTLTLNGPSGAGSYMSFGVNSTQQGAVYANSSGLSLETTTANPMTFWANGSERMRITSTGLVGIGTSSPAAKLDINGGDLYVRTGGTIYGNTFSSYSGNMTIALGGSGNNLIVSGGNVGIGTTSPTVISNYIAQTINGTSGSFTEYQQGGSYAFRIGSDSSTGGFISQTDNNPIRIFTNSAERMRITGSGLVGIGTSSPAANLQITGTADTVIDLTSSAGAYSTRLNLNAAGSGAGLVFSNLTLFCISNTNGVYLSPNATSWTANSDSRIKNIINPINNAVEKLLTLNPIVFSWKTDETNKENLGLIAQEVEEVFPQIVDTQNDEIKTKGVRYTELIPVLIKAIQEQQQQIDELKAKIK